MRVGVRGHSPIFALAIASVLSVPCFANDAPLHRFRDCNTYCPEMVELPRGSFAMGAAPDDVEEGIVYKETPQHQVRIDYRLAVSTLPITIKEWKVCVEEQACNVLPSSTALGIPYGDGRYPATNINWVQAKAYTAWLSKKTGKTYRLLSEAEFEYAERAGTTTPYFTGDKMTPTQANYGYPYHMIIYAAGNYPPNAFGLYDMAGNVSQWVEDCAHKDYRGAPIDGSAWVEAKCDAHVLRGGDVFTGEKSTRSAHRDIGGTNAHFSPWGLRVATVLPG